MKLPERVSVRQRLLLWVMLPVTALAFLWGASTYYAVIYVANMVYDRSLDDMVRSLASQLDTGAGQVSINLPRTAQKIIEYDEIDRVYFSVTDAQGRRLAGNRALPPVPAKAGEMRFQDDRLDGQPVRMAGMSFPQPLAGKNVMVHIAVAETTLKRQMLANAVYAFMMAPLALLVLSVAVLLWLGIGHSLIPLRKISEALASRSHLDLSPLEAENIPVEVRDEIRAINSLMARLKQALDIRQRFIADAAHQLRTPVTVIKAQAELAQRARCEQDWQASVTGLVGGASRLERLVNQLLNLSRTEPGPDRQMEVQPVDLGALMEEVLANLAPTALQKSQQLRVEIPSAPVPVQGNSFFLGEMLANLIDNAIRYTPEGGRIVTRLFIEQDRAVIRIQDNGPGLTDAEKARAFERFYRSPLAGSEGSGLGLAIVREIVLQHDGDIHLETPPRGTGLIVTVCLPLPASIQHR